ncbi:MAG: KH domain-containing protein [Candidatus Cloacimonetes bacterium]|nr:KH domain-containing protein [Candidatus Cloacimonadota bacterium]MBL7108219.1 KH domain-containing protein [Candidatus Cloacimonadota bacterium]
MKELVEMMSKALVDNPDDVKVKEVVGERVTLYELSVGEGEVGKVIGKQGRTANAMRTILNAVSTKQGKRAELEILE